MIRDRQLLWTVVARLAGHLWILFVRHITPENLPWQKDTVSEVRPGRIKEYSETALSFPTHPVYASELLYVCSSSLPAARNMLPHGIGATMGMEVRDADRESDSGRGAPPRG